MGSLATRRCNPKIICHYEELLRAGKAKQPAQVARMHKRPTILNASVGDGKPCQTDPDTT